MTPRSRAPLGICSFGLSCSAGLAEVGCPRGGSRWGPEAPSLQGEVAPLSDPSEKESVPGRGREEKDIDLFAVRKKRLHLSLSLGWGVMEEAAVTSCKR